ncbi:hypothetical protein RB594_000121 [Gaeumannomyces avenae]
MATPPPPETKTIRISQVAGRYLIFDLADVMHLRRAHGMCSVLVGTNPQAPNQNIFSALPLELLPEEAALLVARGDAYLADDPRAHLEALTRAEGERRRALYAQAHRDQRVEVRLDIEEASAARSRAAKVAREARAAAAGKKKDAKRPAEEALVPETAPAVPASDDADEPSLFTSSSPAPPSVPSKDARRNPGGVYLTPSTSAGLLPAPAEEPRELSPPEGCPLYAHLSSRGYFMTPGLRFGGKYSVYPGDPFRFHAHFIANSYGWDEDVELLDLVGTGRLAGAVKKGLLLGAEEPGEGAGGADGANVRTFCVEWAGM